jgi:hypothetical protein
MHFLHRYNSESHFGSGTSVSGAVSCPEEEERTIISLDMSAMSSILSIGRNRDPLPIHPVPLVAFLFEGEKDVENRRATKQTIDCGIKEY